MIDATGIAHWDYDARGQLVKEERQVAGYGKFVTGYEYNSAGLVEKMHYPADDDGTIGEEVVYNYYNQLALSTINGDYTYVYTST